MIAGMLQTFEVEGPFVPVPNIPGYPSPPREGHSHGDGEGGWGTTLDTTCLSLKLTADQLFGVVLA